MNFIIEKSWHDFLSTEVHIFTWIVVSLVHSCRLQVNTKIRIFWGDRLEVVCLRWCFVEKHLKLSIRTVWWFFRFRQNLIESEGSTVVLVLYHALRSFEGSSERHSNRFIIHFLSFSRFWFRALRLLILFDLRQRLGHHLLFEMSRQVVWSRSVLWLFVHFCNLKFFLLDLSFPLIIGFIKINVEKVIFIIGVSWSVDIILSLLILILPEMRGVRVPGFRVFILWSSTVRQWLLSISIKNLSCLIEGWFQIIWLVCHIVLPCCSNFNLCIKFQSCQIFVFFACNFLDQGFSLWSWKEILLGLIFLKFVRIVIVKSSLFIRLHLNSFFWRHLVGIWHGISLQLVKRRIK